MIRKERKQPEGTLPDPYTVYNARAAIADAALLKEANEGMDALMVFAGLFSAVIATLIQITWSMLVPNPNDYTNQVLLSIYNATVHGATNYPVPAEFQPENNAIIINLLFFLSLVLSLGTALGAMLVKEWARQYDPAAGYETIPWIKARDRHRRHEGYVNWPLRAIHATLPMVIHLALLLFLAGIIIWTSQLHYRLYVTLLTTAGLGTIGYFILAFVPAFVQASPFIWPLSKAIKSIVYSSHAYFGRTFGHQPQEQLLQPSYIPSPIDPSIQELKVTQTKPSSYDLMDAAVLVDLLCSSSAHDEIEAAMDALVGGSWQSSSISQLLLRYEKSIFRRYGDLEATCWDVKSGLTGATWVDMDWRIRRLLRFLEWFYYQLNADQRSRVTKWPTADLASNASEHAIREEKVEDILLTDSVLAKLNHVHLPLGSPCTFCLTPGKVRNKYHRINDALGRRNGTLPITYFQNLISACIWSDTDCVLHYAQAGGIEGWKDLTRKTLNFCRGLFGILERDLPPSMHPGMYPLLRSLLDQAMQSLGPSDHRPQKATDHRRVWFEGLFRAMKNTPPIPENIQQDAQTITGPAP